MKGTLYTSLMALVFVLVCNPSFAVDDKELRKQRQVAQKERVELKKQRNAEVSEARKAFRQFSKALKRDYRARLKELDTEFELKRVELESEHDSRVAEAEAAFQQKLANLFLNPGNGFDEQTLARLQDQSKAFSDELFALRKQAAQEKHQATIAIRQRKDALLLEQDRKALDQAESLGLTKDYAPISAEPIGGGLSKQEQRWNEREVQEVAKIKQRNLREMREFRAGESLRDWELANLNEDFRLTWEEKAELQALDSQQIFFNALLMKRTLAEPEGQQAFMDKIVEADKQKKLITIEYRKTREQNRIKRKREKENILQQ